MGRTLFWYLFKDLVKLFLLASIVLAGVMSLGGLLQPLTKAGLDVTQVVQMWLYLMPAMMTYSMPVAAVFATSMVYGRLSADNELTACRAAGISYKSIVAPAVAMGIVGAIVSLLFLSFVVPFFFLRGEQVIYANVSKYIASEIQRKHEFSLGKSKPSIFAQQAFVPGTSGKGGEQVVVLERPTIVTYSYDPADPSLRVPKTFSMAGAVTLYIRRGEDNSAEVWGVLKDVTTFSRVAGSRPQVGIGQTEFGPVVMPSPIKQQVKFMDVMRLRGLLDAPENTERVQRAIRLFVETEQQQMLYRKIAIGATQGPGYSFGDGEQYELSAPGATWSIQGSKSDQLRLQAGERPVRMTIRRTGGGITRIADARSATIIADMDNEANLVVVRITLEDVTLPVGDEQISKATDQQICTVPMSAELQQVRGRRVADFLTQNSVSQQENILRLKREQMVATNEIIVEMHSRASYGISCLVLVLVGSVLGMQFKSGDFLTAFSVSVIPALLTITLVVSGGQVSTDVPMTLVNPLPFGLSLIWAGNVVAALLAAWLFSRIRKT